MPSSWSTSLRFELQFTGENINLWGDKLDAVLQHVDYSIAGWLAKTISGDYALTTANAADDEARAAMVKLNGSPTANFAITIPAVPKSYWLWNATAKVATITTGAGATVAIDAGDRAPVWCDGANVNTITYGGLSLKDFIAASVLAATGALPATTGNEGKSLFIRSGVWTPAQVQSTDIGDFDAQVLRKTLVFSLIFGGA